MYRFAYNRSNLAVLVYSKAVMSNYLMLDYFAIRFVTVTIRKNIIVLLNWTYRHYDQLKSTKKRLPG